MDLAPAEEDALATLAHTPNGPAALIAHSPADLRLQLDKTAEGTSLIPGLLAFVIALALIEALLANRHVPRRSRSEPSPHVGETPDANLKPELQSSML